MGLFEIKKELSKEVEADNVDIKLVFEFESLTGKDLDKKSDNIIAEIRKALDGVGDIKDVSAISQKLSNTFKVDSRSLFGTKYKDSYSYKKTVSMKFTVDITDKNKIDQIKNVLVKAMGFKHEIKDTSPVNEMAIAVRIEYADPYVKDILARKAEITKELMQECRKEAENIVSNLGSEISSIDTIVFNSDGDFVKARTAGVMRKASTDSLENDCCYEGGLDGFPDCFDDDSDTDDFEIEKKKALRREENLIASYIDTIKNYRCKINTDVKVVYKLAETYKYEENM